MTLNLSRVLTAPTESREDVSSAARTASGNSAWIESDGYGIITPFLDVTAVSGTTPTLHVELEVSEDGVNPIHLYSFFRVAATGVQQVGSIPVFTRYYRYKWTIAGTTPSFTFSINATLKAYGITSTRQMIRYANIDMATTGAVSSSFDADNCTNVIFQAIRGADGGTSGTLRIDASNDGTNWIEISNNIVLPQNTTNGTAFSSVAWKYYRARVQANTNAGTRTPDLIWRCNGGI